jgi:hypothetical protein
MRHAVSKDLYDYWNRLRGARSAPDRSDIDPAAIRHVLADTFIIEIDGQCSFPIRLCGTRMNALWLADQKGRSFLDLWSDRDRRDVAAALLTVIDGVSPVVAGARATAAREEPLDLELLLLPLRHFGKTHSRLLGSFAPAYQVSWLGKLAAQPLELLSMRVIAPKPQRAPGPLFAVNPRRDLAFAQRPRLVVHEGGKRS